MCAKVFSIGHWPSSFLWNKLFLLSHGPSPSVVNLWLKDIEVVSGICKAFFLDSCHGLLLLLGFYAWILHPILDTRRGMGCQVDLPGLWVWFSGQPPYRPEGRSTAQVEKEEKEEEPEPENQRATDLQRLVDIAHQFDDNGGQGPVLGEAMGQVGVAGVDAWAGPRSSSCLAENSAVSPKRWTNSSLRHVLPTALAGTAPMISWCLHQLATVCLREMGRANGKAGPAKQFSEQPMPWTQPPRPCPFLPTWCWTLSRLLLGFLVGMYGAVLLWPQARLRATRRTLFTAMGQLWRKLLDPWGRYPWLLADLLLLSVENQQRKAQVFFAEPDCCLDSFSAKLKAVVGPPEGPLEEDTLLFLWRLSQHLLSSNVLLPVWPQSPQAKTNSPL